MPEGTILCCVLQRPCCVFLGFTKRLSGHSFNRYLSSPQGRHPCHSDFKGASYQVPFPTPLQGRMNPGLTQAMHFIFSPGDSVGRSIHQLMWLIWKEFRMFWVNIDYSDFREPASWCFLVSSSAFQLLCCGSTTDCDCVWASYANTLLWWWWTSAKCSID